MKRNALKSAFPYTIPIFAGFLFLGMSYGFLMRSQGFSFLYPMLMSLFIYAGSMEFVTISLLLSTFHPAYAFFLTLLVNARHLFYGISMLDTYKNVGWKKIYLIYGMCDESFSIHASITPPPDVDKGWFLFFITLLNHIYWVMGATLGGLLGYLIHFDTTGLSFVMTALFVVMFLEQWKKPQSHQPASIGLISSALCLLVFGPEHFLLPAMFAIILSLTFLRKKTQTEADLL